MTYAKLFATITDSSLWSASKDARILFVSLLARADATGFIEAALPGLARMANLTLDETKAALEELMAPDPYSKSPAHEGRRIVAAPRGWCLVNYEDYRARRNEEERREYMREYMKNYREASPDPRKQSVNSCKQSVNFCKQSKPRLAQAEAEAEAEAGEKEERACALAHDPDPIFSQIEKIIESDRIQSQKIAAAPVVYSWQDWRRDHPRIGIGRTGEDGDLEAWRDLWKIYERDCFDPMYAALLRILPEGKKIWYSQAAEWLAKNTTDT